LNTLKHKQQGATLIVALVMLVLLTMLAVSSINLSTTNLKIVGNMQAQKYMDAAAQDAIEQVMSTANTFTAPASTTVSTAMGNVTVSRADCLGGQIAQGYSAVVANIIPQDNTWEIVATTDPDPVTGASSTIHQGVQMRMLAGNCPAPPP
jgi:Tfp pilus assembly protein PilX